MTEPDPVRAAPAAPRHVDRRPRQLRRRPYVLHVIRTWPRLFICLGIAVLAGLLLPRSWQLTTRLLLCWNFGAIVFFWLIWSVAADSTRQSMRKRASDQDAGRFAILLISVAAAVASLAAIIIDLGAAKDVSGLDKAFRVGLAGLTIVTAWTFIHVMFALHYAHEYFREKPREHDAQDHDDKAHKDREEIEGGLHFPGTPAPGYLDFCYFSFIIGVASQTADVEITSKPMRRISLVHSILAFFFNTTLLALMINIAAGLI